MVMAYNLSGDTHFLLPLHYLPFCFPILFLKDIYNHLQSSPSISEHYVEFPLPFVILSSVLSFTSPVSPLDRLRVDMDFNMDFTNDPYFYFYPYLCLFLSSFLSSFPYVTSLTFISGVLIFLSHIVIDCPLAGLYPFLLGSPARCTE